MTDTLNDLTNALQTYVVAPLNAFGLGGYVFDVRGEENALLAADITDHYTEDNKAVQDHIAIKPKKITLKGYVGEVVFNGPGATNSSIIQQVTQKLTVIDGFLPQMSAAATQAQAAISGIDSAGGTLSSFAAAIPAAANIYGLVKNTIGTFSGNTPRQQSAYQYFSACQSQGILMGIQTPWEFLTNMAIETIIASQGEDSVFITDFSITFKQIRIAQTLTASSILTNTGGICTSADPTGAAAIQGQAQTNNGGVPGLAPPFSSVVSGIQGAMTGVSSFVSANISPIFKY